MNVKNRVLLDASCDMRPALVTALAALNFAECTDDGSPELKLLCRVDVDNGKVVAEAAGRNGSFIHSESYSGTGEKRRKVIKAAVIALQKASGAEPGRWGILRGVRPTKLADMLMPDGVERARRVLSEDCLLADEIVDLLIEISDTGKKIYRAEYITNSSACLYVSVPFCPGRCSYCSFPSWPLPDEAAIMEYLAALRQEYALVRQLAEKIGRNICSIYIGGGTPASLGERFFSVLLENLRAEFPETGEFTVECGRPELIQPAIADALQAFSASRVCINPQSLNDRTLAAVGRKHDAAAVYRAYDLVRSRFSGAINMDLIAGLADETETDFARSLDRVVGLAPESITVHSLALKRGADMFVDGSLSAARVVNKMLDYSGQRTAQNGYRPYYLYRQKNSIGANTGYCRCGCYCLYNMMMIGEQHTIFGAGAAAATKAVFDKRLESVYNPKDYRLYTVKLAEYLAKKERLFKNFC